MVFLENMAVHLAYIVDCSGCQIKFDSRRLRFFSTITENVLQFIYKVKTIRLPLNNWQGLVALKQQEFREKGLKLNPADVTVSFFVAHSQSSSLQVTKTLAGGCLTMIRSW
jgi:hypothetical protein